MPIHASAAELGRLPGAFAARGPAIVTDLTEAAMDAHFAEFERLCDRTADVGPRDDPYALSCDRDRGHRGPHEGPCPYGGNERWRWTGGGSCAGDPLPVRVIARGAHLEAVSD